MVIILKNLIDIVNWLSIILFSQITIEEHRLQSGFAEQALEQSAIGRNFHRKDFVSDEIHF